MRPPFRQTGWDVSCVTAAQTLALIPPVAAAIVLQGLSLTILFTALVVTLIWEVCFSVTRGRDLHWHGITTALIFVVLAPETVAVWQIALALSFGVVLGELIFGGRGFGFLNAAVVSLAFLVFSFPETELSRLSPTVAYACLPGAALLLLTGLISWRIIAAMLIAVLAVTAMKTQAIPEIFIAPSILFVLIFMICDPVAASVTNGGRWLYGILIGFLIAVFNAGATLDFSTESLIFATLLGTIFAPLLDDIVVRLKIRKRRRRNG